MIAVEYEPGLLIETSNDVLPLFTEFANIGLNLDTCHTAVLNENIFTIIRKFGKKIFHTHVSDCKDKIHHHLIPGLGEIDFKAMYCALNEINYDGFLTAELYPYFQNPEDAAIITLNYFKQIMEN